eukprot:gene24899-28145_t
MVDLKFRKIFLRKSPCPNELTKEDFFVGGKISLYSRELEIVDYGDLKTKEKLHFQVQQSVAILTQSSYNDWGKLITQLTGDMTIVKMKTVIMAQNMADRVCGVLNLGPRRSVDFSNGVSLVILLHGADGFNKMDRIIKESGNGAIYGASNGVQGAELQSILLESPLPTTATFDSCTCVVIKPHAVKSKLTGDIMSHIIAQGYEISAISALQFQREQAEEFLKVYKGVIPDYADHVAQLCLGTAVALEVRAQDPVRTFRETAGPWDVEMARELRPDTIRGRFGVDRAKSAVHCTDLPQDGVLECEYVFKVMS